MPETAETPLGRLKKAVIAQKTAALPDPPKDPLLQPIYDLIYEFDQYTTLLVINVLQGGSEAQDYPQRNRIDKLISDLDASLDSLAKRELDLYNNYLRRLDNMIVLVKAVVSERAIKKE